MINITTVSLNCVLTVPHSQFNILCTYISLHILYLQSLRVFMVVTETLDFGDSLSFL